MSIEVSNILHNLLVFENDLGTIKVIAAYINSDRISVNLYLKATREVWINKTMNKDKWLKLKQNLELKLIDIL
jgi:hypothetical protein